MDAAARRQARFAGPSSGEFAAGSRSLVGMRVFVSYSRAQFYFAEDLALALREHQIDPWFDVHRLQPGDDWAGGIEAALRASQAFVLVASKEALGSSYVQEELTLARELQLPVLVALTEPVDLPPTLEDAPCFDLRRGFERKLGALVGALDGRTVSVTSGGQAGVVRLLPFMLLAVAAVCGAISLSALISPMGSRQPLGALVFVLSVPFCVWLAWEVAHRKPKRVLPLLVVLVSGALLGAAVVIPAVELAAGHGPLWMATAPILLLLSAAMIAPPFWVARSPAFYRWCPTGSAPRRLRRRMLARRGYRGGPAPRGMSAISYALHSSAPDTSVRRALDAALQARHHRPVEGGSADRQICVVSDLTPLAWLQDTLARLHGRVILVISAPVLLDALRNIERYQWVDHRRRRRRTLANLAATIGSSPGAVDTELVPERLSARVLPLPIFLFCGLYASTAAFMLASGVSMLVGADLGDVYGKPPSLVTIPAAAVTCALPAYTGIVVATRRVSLRVFLALFVGTVATLVAFQRLMYPDARIWLVAVPVLFGIVYLAAAWRALAGWLPRDGVDRGVPRLAPAPTRWWRRPAARRTLMATVAYTALYVFVATSISGPPPSSSQPSQVVLGPGYRLTLPSGWSDVTDQTSVGVRYDFVFIRGNSVFRVGHGPATADAATLSGRTQQRLSEVGAEILDASGPITLDGEDQTACFGFEMADALFISHGEQVITVRDGVAYVVILAAPRSRYWRGNFDPLLSSWRWTS
jgi:hypothetical protein